MIKTIAIGVVLFFFMEQSAAQIGPERAALKAIEKKKWAKAQDRLRRVIRNDSVSALGKYLLSLYYFEPDNPAYHVDSAYYYVTSAIQDFFKSSTKQYEKLRRFPLDTTMIVRLRVSIDSAAFEQARTINTEQALLRFLADHPHSAYQKQAMELRDELAYLNAVTLNTHEAFQYFLTQYPNAARAAEARKKYDFLLYQAKTTDKRLESFELFLEDHPETPFRKEIEQHIFELYTLSGEVERFLSFMQKYPLSSQTKRALDIVFHILQEKDDTQWPGLFATDSLQNIRKLEESYLVPFFRDGKFGFMDKNGTEIISATTGELDGGYKCGNIIEDVLVLPDRVLARDGSTIYEGYAEEVDDIGAGYIKIKYNECYTIMHKSGFRIENCVADAKILGTRFLGILTTNGWMLYSLAGRKVMPESWDDFMIGNNIIALKKDEKWHLVGQSQLVALSAQQKPTLLNPYDEIKMLSNGMIWVKRNKFEGVLDHTLTDFIPLDNHKLTSTFFGFIGQTKEGFTIYDRNGRQASYFDMVILNEPWVVVKKNPLWYLFDSDSLLLASQPYDSIRFEGPFAVGIKYDSLIIHLPGQGLIPFPQPAIVQFIPGKDSTSFIALETVETIKQKKGKSKIPSWKTVYNLNGKQLFKTNVDKIQYAGHDLFIVHRKEKKGLIDAMGKMVLPLEYDAIGSVTNDVVSLLKSMKFGLYNVSSQKLLKPQFDKNLIPYTNRTIVAYRDGHYRFIDWDNKYLSPHEFEEIMYWNDTSALVKKNKNWMLFNITSKQIALSNIYEIKIIKDNPEEKIAIVRQDEMYGVLSNKKGMIIPFAYSDLVNIGSAEEPLFFTEKHIIEASVFVVIYYDRNGKLLRREVYEEPDEYEKIYCPDN